MNNDWIPVSMRLGNKPLFELSDWIPDEVKSSVVSIIRRIIDENNINLNIFIARLHVPNILNYSIEERFFWYLNESQENFIDCIDFIVFNTNTYYEECRGLIVELNDILRYSNTNWMIASDKNTYKLMMQRRVLPETQEHYSSLANSVDGLTGRHLREAWRHAYMHDGDYKQAWESARKAVECLLHPIVSPKNNRATITTMIRDIDVKHDKWECDIPAGNDTPVNKFLEFLRMMPYEPGHHGQSDGSIAEREAQVQVAVAFTICQILHDKGFRRKNK
jgi:hypothetical protein